MRLEWPVLTLVAMLIAFSVVRTQNRLSTRWGVVTTGPRQGARAQLTSEISHKRYPIDIRMVGLVWFSDPDRSRHPPRLCCKTLRVGVSTPRGAPFPLHAPPEARRERFFAPEDPIFD